MLAWSCTHDLMSVEGHLAQTRLCLSRMKAPADNSCGSMGKAEGQSSRKLRIVKATIRSVGSAL